jgi:biotin carboxyl carrier protein
MNVVVKINDQVFDVEIENLLARPVIAIIEGQRFEVWPDSHPQPEKQSVGYTPPKIAQLPTNGKTVPNGSPNVIRAPIPGVIIAVHVQPGDYVTVGQDLCILEAMKMKNAIRSPREGQIASVAVTAGQQVGYQETLFEFVSQGER